MLWKERTATNFILQKCVELENESNAEMIGSDDLYKAQLLNFQRHIYQPSEVTFVSMMIWK